MLLKQFRTVLLVALLGSMMTGCGMFGGEEDAAPTPPPPVTQARSLVSAEAFVHPIREANLSFEVSGRVVELLVQEGDSVQAGAVLARLDDTVPQAALTEARANLKSREADLRKAEADLMRAEAEYANTAADPTPEEIAEREATLAKAEAVLAEQLTGPTAEEIAEAEARVQTTRAELANLLAGSRDEEIQRQAALVLQREASVRDAQRAYDKVRYGDPEDVGQAGTNLQRATLDYEQALADYERLINGSTEEEVAIQRSRVAEQQAALARVLSGRTAEQIAQAQADVAQQEAALAGLLAGATVEELAISEQAVHGAEATVGIAESNVETAQAQVARSEAELASYQLTAPFAGIVGLISFDVGEFISNNSSAMAIGDTSEWQIETDDLTEIDVVNVALGQSVSISVDALPDVTYQGEVARITPRSETKAGDVTYTVIIDIVEDDTSRLRWGMTTFVDITTGEGE